VWLCLTFFSLPYIVRNELMSQYVELCLLVFIFKDPLLTLASVPAFLEEDLRNITTITFVALLVHTSPYGSSKTNLWNSVVVLLILQIYCGSGQFQHGDTRFCRGFCQGS
jgi:hypothetical protein